MSKITVDDLVRREVLYCASYLISALCKGYGDTNGELGELCEQAFELCTPIDDFEEAAIQEGWADVTDTAKFPDYSQFKDSTDGQVWACKGWQELCYGFDIEPYQREIYEHWIVSDWLADKLTEKGERVDKDIAGMIIWGRTTSGQGIASDSVILEIHGELVA